MGTNAPSLSFERSERGNPRDVSQIWRFGERRGRQEMAGKVCRDGRKKVEINYASSTLLAVGEERPY